MKDIKQKLKIIVAQSYDYNLYIRLSGLTQLYNYSYINSDYNFIIK